jgi:choline-sulfatase
MAAPPPSFLVLMADQLAASWLPVYGHPVVLAPHLEALADGAAVFDSAYCASPLCAPSRAAMLTGRHASSIGVFDNAAELPATTPTVVHALRAAGYHTAVAGKMHFVGPDQLHGFEERLTTDIYPSDVDWTPDWSRPLEEPLPWYHTMEGVLNPGVTAASLQTDYDQEVAFVAARKLYEIARHRPDQPFLLFASFSNPHDPWEVPERFWARYRRSEVPLPSVSSLPIDGVDPHSRRLRAMCRVDEVGLSDDQIRRARHAYFAAISYVDERIGEVLGALRDSGLQERTTVIFCTDHGEMLGERGLWYKMSFFEQSARVPLIVRDFTGRVAARRVSTPVSLLDVTPTLLELAGLPLDALAGSGDGESLLSARVRPVISEYHGEGVHAPSAMIRSRDEKLIVSLQDPDLLFDLAADPLELASRQAEEPALREALESELDLRDIDRRVRVSQRERHLISAALHRGRPPAWDHQPVVDASVQYVRNRDDIYALQRRARLDSGDPDRL